MRHRTVKFQSHFQARRSKANYSSHLYRCTNTRALTRKYSLLQKNGERDPREIISLADYRAIRGSTLRKDFRSLIRFERVCISPVVVSRAEQPTHLHYWHNISQAACWNNKQKTRQYTHIPPS